ANSGDRRKGFDRVDGGTGLLILTSGKGKASKECPLRHELPFAFSFEAPDRHVRDVLILELLQRRCRGLRNKDRVDEVLVHVVVGGKLEARTTAEATAHARFKAIARLGIEISVGQDFVPKGCIGKPEVGVVVRRRPEASRVLPEQTIVRIEVISDAKLRRN